MSELYTGQRVDNGEWVTGNYIHQYHSYKKGRRINAIVVSNEIKSFRYEILDETLKQITGKKIKALQRQLEEATKFIQDVANHDFDLADMCKYKVHEKANEVLSKLKDKGDENEKN